MEAENQREPLAEDDVQLQPQPSQDSFKRPKGQKKKKKVKKRRIREVTHDDRLDNSELRDILHPTSMSTQAFIAQNNNQGPIFDDTSAPVNAVSSPQYDQITRSQNDLEPQDLSKSKINSQTDIKAKESIIFHPNKSDSPSLNSEHEKDFYVQESNEDNPFGIDLQQQRNQTSSQFGSDLKHHQTPQSKKKRDSQASSYQMTNLGDQKKDGIIMSSFGDISIHSAISDNKYKFVRNINHESTDQSPLGYQSQPAKLSSQIIEEEDQNDPNFTIAKIERTDEQEPQIVEEAIQQEFPIKKDLKLKVTIVEANFLKDKGDMMGAQDPFMQFQWLGQIYRTPTLDNAGKYAYFNSEFWLDNFLSAREGAIKFEAYDDDGLSCDFLSTTQEITINQILDEIKDNDCEPLKKFFSQYDENMTKEVGDLLVVFELWDTIGNLYKEIPPTEVENEQLDFEQEVNPFQTANLSQLMNQEDKYPVIEMEDMDKDSMESQGLNIPSHSPPLRGGTNKKRQGFDENFYSHEGSEVDNPDTTKKSRPSKKQRKKSAKKGMQAQKGATPSQPTRKKPAPGGSKFGGLLDKKQDEDDFFEPLSYKKLKKMITENHPVDPDTKDKLSMTERITVKDYFPKIMDACCFYRMRIFFKKLKKSLMKRFKDENQKFQKPPSMKNIPSSDTSSSGSGQEDDPRAKGLTTAAQNLGEGATLYLQSMKTLAIMFTILSVINFPLYFIYQSSTLKNNYGNLATVFKFFTIGNMGITDTICDWSQIDLYNMEQGENLKQLKFKCPKDQYISELKTFGFLYKNDKRLNDLSHGASFCYAAENPSAEPKNFNPKKPVQKSDENSKKDTNDKRLLLDEDLEDNDPTTFVIEKDFDEHLYEKEYHLRKLQGMMPGSPNKPGSEQQEVKSKTEKKEKEEVQEGQGDEDEEESEESAPTDGLENNVFGSDEDGENSETKSSHHNDIAFEDLSKQREKERQQEQEDIIDDKSIIGAVTTVPSKHITQSQCLSCIKSVNSKNRYCATPSYSGSVCCFEDSKDVWCNETADIPRQCTALSENIPDQFSKALCVNSEKCSGAKRIGVKMIHDRELADNVDMEDGDFCAYIIEPIVKLADNDFINLKIAGLDKNDATVYIIKEDKEGNIEYIPGDTFAPSNNKFFSFFLRKMQIYENKREGIQEDKGTMKNRTTNTYYKLLVVIEPKTGQKGDWKLTVQKEKGVIKPIDEKFESIEQRNQRYSRMYEIWNRTNDLVVTNQTLLDQEFFPEKTPYNTDVECMYDKNYKSSKSLFLDSKYNRWFTEYWKHHCLNKPECEMNPSYDSDSEVDDMDFGNMNQTLILAPKLSDNCIQRMRYRNITSQHFIMIYGCREDHLHEIFTNQKLHKENIGILIVVIDIVSILIMAFFFGKLSEINQEYLDIMDDMTVQMKDFAIKIDDVTVDRYTQDSRVLKMKLWHHFTDILRSKRTIENDMEVVDVTLSLYTMPSIQLVFRMQELQLEINDIQQKDFAGYYKDDERQDKIDEMKQIKDKLRRMKARYIELTQKRDKKKTNTQKIPKSQRIQQVQYVFVVFKNCTTNEVVLEMFKKDTGILKFFKNIFFFNSPTVQQLLFCNRELNVFPPLEPDEIIWENLAYTGDEQYFRKILMQIISIIFLVLTTVLTIYIGSTKKLTNILIPDVKCPDYYQKRDPYELDYKRQTYKDYLLPSEKTDGLMGCFCERHTALYLPWTLFFMQFNDIRTELGEQATNRFYCLEYRLLWVTKSVVLFIVATSAVLINGVISDIFKTLGEYTKKHTKVEEQSTSFRQIFLMEFTNMGLIQLLSSLSLFRGLNEMLLGFSKNLIKKSHDSFNCPWYMDTGKSICFFIFMSAFLSNIADMRLFVISSLKRFYDRGYKVNLKKDPEDEDDDEPNTKKKIQKELENLYMGKVFAGEKAYSRMMSTMFVILLYSSGMPILYFTGVIFYWVTYYVHKILIIQFYQKSRTLTRTIPLFSMKFLSIGIIVHILGACFMLTNPDPFDTKEPLEREWTPLKDLISYVASISGDETNGQKLEDDWFFTLLKSRVGYLHQQLYVSFIILFTIFYFIGKSIYAIALFVVLGIYDIFLTLLEKMKKCLKRSKKRFNARMNNEEYESDVSEESSHYSTSSSSKSGDFSIDDLWESSSSSSSSSSSDTDSDEEKQQARQLRKMDKQEQKEIRAQERQEKREMIIQKNEKKRLANLELRKRRPDYSENILKELNALNLSNFYERSIKELADFKDIFNVEPHEDMDQLFQLVGPEDEETIMQKQFREICYMSRLTADQVQKYQKFLKKRIRDIENTINSHFHLIKQTLIQQHKDVFERERKRKKKNGNEGSLQQQLQNKLNEKNFLEEFEAEINDITKYTCDIRMKKLVEQFDDLVKADKSRKENRSGNQEICRMIGSLSQSYFIFDCHQYKVARRIYYGMDDEDQHNHDNAEGAEILDQFINDEGPEGEDESDYDEEMDETVDQPEDQKQKKGKKSGRNSQKSVRSNKKK